MNTVSPHSSLSNYLVGARIVLNDSENPVLITYYKDMFRNTFRYKIPVK